MIENTRHSARMKDTRKDYYLITDNHQPIGVCTSESMGEICLCELAREHSAIMLNQKVFIYKDDSGEHLLRCESVKKMSIG